jgi:hypothetical protein
MVVMDFRAVQGKGNTETGHERELFYREDEEIMEVNRPPTAGKSAKRS